MRRFVCKGILLLGIVIAHAVFSTSYAASIVTRDDFLCYDTSSEDLHPFRFLSGLALDEKGNFYVTYPTYSMGFQFLRFDEYGEQALPTATFLPDTTNDTIWTCNHLFFNVYANDAGMTNTPFQATCPTVARPFCLLGDSLGNLLKPAKAMFFESQYDGYYKDCMRGAINNEGIIGGVWRASEESLWAIGCSVFVRLYYPWSDSFSSPIQPMTLPHPLDSLEAEGGSYQLGDVMHYPQMGIAGDGSFAVAWVVQEGYMRVFYAVYNADGTPRTDSVRMADCDAGFFDTTQCASILSENMEMAMETDGDFYIAWREMYHQGPVWMRGFNADGSPKYAPVLVHDADFSEAVPDWHPVWPTISCDDSGNVLIVFSDWRNYNYGDDIPRRDVFAQKIDHEGNLVGPNYRLNNDPGHVNGYISFTTVRGAINNAGQAIVTWCEWDSVDVETGAVVAKAQLMPYHDIGTFIPGDINFDLSCDVGDIIVFVNYLFCGGLGGFWPPDLIDLNGSGSNGDVGDLTFLIAYLFQGGPEPSTPHEGIRPPLQTCR